MSSIKKELLIARLSYLDELGGKPGSKATNPTVIAKVKELIEKEEITDYMSLESVFNFLVEKLEQDQTKVDFYAQEIISFIN